MYSSKFVVHYSTAKVQLSEYLFEKENRIILILHTTNERTLICRNLAGISKRED